MGKRRIGICCPGGGAAGCAQAGMLMAFRNLLGLESFAAAAGASVGALNLALWAQGGDLGDVWHNLRRKDIYTKWKMLRLFSDSYYSTTPLQNLIAARLDAGAVNAAPVHLTLQGCNRDTGEAVLWQTGEPELAEMLLASSAIPVAFPQVFAKNTWQVDGGVVDNSPLLWLVMSKCNPIFVLHCSPATLPKTHNGRLSRARMLVRLLRLFYQASQHQDSLFITMHNQIAREGGRNADIIRTIDVYPSIDVGTLDFEQPLLAKGYDDGYSAACVTIAQHRKECGL
jgi:predicted acylesterase/phospholipase RssA